MNQKDVNSLMQSSPERMDYQLATVITIVDNLRNENGMFKQQLADKSVDLQMKSSIVVQLQQQLADSKARAEELEKELNRLADVVSSKDSDIICNLLRGFTALKKGGAKCEWKKDANNGGVYFTSCNNANEFTAGELDDNSYIYCPYCGKKIKEAK